MIDAAQRKLREAEFFCGALRQEHRSRHIRNPEAFAFYLSAFLSATRSVTWALQKDEKAKYDAWSPGWFKSLSEDERQLCDFMVERRNEEQKEGGAKTRMTREMVPMVDVIRTEHREHPAYGFQYFWPPGTPAPEFERSVYRFIHLGGEDEVTATCERYLGLLRKLVKDFLAAHP